MRDRISSERWHGLTTGAPGSGEALKYVPVIVKVVLADEEATTEDEGTIGLATTPGTDPRYVIIASVHSITAWIDSRYWGGRRCA